MLKNDFYTVEGLSTTDDSMSCTVRFNPAHEIFKGHFPGQPVVPGVCMIQMVKEMLGEHLGKPMFLRSTGQVKFLQLITPNISPVLNLSWKQEGHSYIVTASFKGDTDLFKLMGTFE
jgi:3-hydroxyacyl-[acyl-carrier-protein] dehydratase